MKKDWTYKKLGEVTKIKTGKLDANASSEDGIYPFFTCSKEPLRISSYSYDCECVLVAGNGDLNVKYYKGKFDAYQRTYIIETTPDSGIMTYYMYHFFNKYIETLRQKSIGGIIKYIKLGDLTEATIPVPPISIQESIVRELDAIHGILEKKQELLRELDNLAQAIFYDMFGDPITNPKQWEVKRLDSLCENCDYMRKPITASDREAGSIPYYGASGIVDYVKDYIFDGDYLLVSEDGANLLARSTPIAFSITGKNWVNNHAHVLKFKESCTQLYIQTLINLIDISGIVTGAVQPKLNQAQLNKFSLPLPPLSLQQSFAAKIEAIEAQKQAVQQSIREVEALLAERMDHYFG